MTICNPCISASFSLKSKIYGHKRDIQIVIIIKNLQKQQWQKHQLLHVAKKRQSSHRELQIVASNVVESMDL